MKQVLNGCSLGPVVDGRKEGRRLKEMFQLEKAEVNRIKDENEIIRQK